MKKVLLTAMAVLTVASASLFGMYGADGDDWIAFLVHGNQLRVRMDQLGFVLGNGTIKGTVGLRADNGYMGNIFNYKLDKNTLGDESSYFSPTISAGIGYTSDLIGIGVGYNFTYIDRFVQVHTPTLVLNALNNSLRLAVPIQVAVGDIGNSSTKFTGVGFNNIELRYLTGIDAFNQIRFYASYVNASWDVSSEKTTAETFTLQLRLYFLRTQVGNVTVNPYIRIDYDQAMKGGLNKNYLTIGDAYAKRTLGISDNSKQSDIYDVSPFRVFVKPVLSLAASSDIVSLYFEPSLGYAVSSGKGKGQKNYQTQHALNWGAYTELYITPVKDLEWYFEMDVNGNVTGKLGANSANSSLPPVYFETTTGITWYLPSLGGGQ